MQESPSAIELGSALLGNNQSVSCLADTCENKVLQNLRCVQLLLTAGTAMCSSVR